MRENLKMQDCRSRKSVNNVAMKRPFNALWGQQSFGHESLITLAELHLKEILLKKYSNERNVNEEFWKDFVVVVVSMLAFSSDDPSSNPAQVFLHIFLFGII